MSYTSLMVANRLETQFRDGEDWHAGLRPPTDDRVQRLFQECSQGVKIGDRLFVEDMGDSGPAAVAPIYELTPSSDASRSPADPMLFAPLSSACEPFFEMDSFSAETVASPAHPGLEEDDRPAKLLGESSLHQAVPKDAPQSSDPEVKVRDGSGRGEKIVPTFVIEAAPTAADAPVIPVPIPGVLDHSQIQKLDGAQTGGDQYAIKKNSRKKMCSLM
jgi:hypothetical protein